MCYSSGVIVEKNLKIYDQYMYDAAKLGHVDASYNIGENYYLGQRCRKSLRKARKFFKASSEGGNLKGNVYYAHMLVQGKGGFKNVKKGLDIYEVAAKSGHAPAQVKLGLHYSGDLLSKHKNYPRALMWLKKAMDQDDPTAFYVAGMMNRDGKGCPKNSSEAYRLMKIGASLNEPNCIRIMNVSPADIARQEEKSRPSQRYPLKRRGGGTCTYCGSSFGEFQAFETGECSKRCFDQANGYNTAGRYEFSLSDIDLPLIQRGSGTCDWCGSHFGMNEGYEGELCSRKCYVEWFNS